MLIGPIAWLEKFLSEEDDKHTPYLGELMQEHTPDYVQEAVRMVQETVYESVQNIGLRVVPSPSASQQSGTVHTEIFPMPELRKETGPDSDDELFMGEDKWKVSFMRALESIQASRLPLFWVHLATTAPGVELQARIRECGMDAEAFASMHSSPEFAGLFLPPMTRTYYRYITLCALLYEKGFDRFELLLALPGRYWTMAELLSYFDLHCRQNVERLIDCAEASKEQN